MTYIWKKYLSVHAIIVCGLIFISTTLGQETDDNLKTSLDSLLNLTVEKIEYAKSASRYYQMPADAPSSVSIISKKEIETSGKFTLDEILNSQKGFYLTNDRNYDYLGVRGFSRPTDYNNRVLLLINGHRLNDDFYNAAYIGKELGLELFNFDQVEIIRGPGSALFGSSAMFSTISITTDYINTGIIPQLKASLGSFNSKRISVNWGFEPFENLHVFVKGSASRSGGESRIYYAEYDSIDTNNGVAEDKDKDNSYGIIAGLEYNNFTLTLFSSSYEKYIPTAAWANDYNSDQKTVDNFQFIEGKYSYKLSSNLTGISELSYDRYYFEGGYIINGLIENESNNTDAYGFKNHFIWDIKEYDRLLFGFEYKKINRANYRYNSYDQPENIYINKPYDIISFYIQNELQINRDWTLYLGLRSDKYK